MNRPEAPGFGYTTTPYRIEHRPTYGPHSKQDLVAILDLLQDCGVKAWWYSVSTKGSYPIFRSRHLPYRDDAVDYLAWLADEAHRRDIALFSWEYLSTAPMLGAQHPEWRWRFFDWDGPQIPRDTHYVCYNSPYGRLLKDFCVEVVNDLGFDGIWFDGPFLLGHGATGTYACCCGSCTAKYEHETGRAMPATVDLHDLAFREYLEWRQDDHTEYWRELSGYVHERKPNAIIVMNYFNRFWQGPECGSPLRRMAGDAPEGPGGTLKPPMKAMIAAERGYWPQQVLLMTKTLRAINDNYPPEVWAPGTDSTGGQSPDLNPANLLFHAYTCATGGGFASFGVGTNLSPDGGPLEDCRSLFRTLTATLEPLAPYVGGEPERLVGLVQSGATKDYTHVREDGGSADPGPAWAAVHGMHNLLNGLHLPTEVLLDNMLCEPFLDRYAAVVLPEVQCVSDEAAEQLRCYVENGGLLLAVGETGTLTPLGEPRDKGVLDDLLGISWRDTAVSRPVVALQDEVLTAPFPNARLAAANGFSSGLPEALRLCGTVRLVRTETATVRATACYTPGPSGKVFSPQGLVRQERGGPVSGAVILVRDVGRGRAITIAANIAREYGEAGPRQRSRELIGRLLLERTTPPFLTDAPPNVVVALWRQGSRRVFHLLNVPSALLFLPFGRPPAYLPEDITPTGPVRLSLPGKWTNVSSPTHPEHVAAEHRSDRVQITLSRLNAHAAIVAE